MTHRNPERAHRDHYVSNRVIACVFLALAVLIVPYGAVLLLLIAFLIYQCVKHARRKPAHLR